MIDLECGACGQGMQADDDMAGGRVKCPKCGNLWAVPDESGAVPADEPAPRLNVLWIVLRAMLVAIMGISALHMIVGEGPIPLQTGAVCIAVALAGLACSTPRLRG